MNAITEPLCRELQETACRIRDRVSRTAYDIGADLLAAKEKCKFGQWTPFLTAAGLHERSAQRLMSYCRAIEADPSIDPGKSLPSMRSILGANTTRVSYLTDDAVDEKLVQEAEQRATGWQHQADNPPEPEPRKRTPAPEPEPLEGEVIRPSSPEQKIASMQVYIDELEAKLEAAEERVAIALAPDIEARITGLEAQINTLRSQLANCQEENRRHLAHINHLKDERG